MKQILLMIAVVALLGCGDGGITQCYWCKEDIKKGALICKHCGKSPDSAAENERPDNPSSGGPKNKPPADSWANESHPDQVSIREVETDKSAFAGKFFEDGSLPQPFVIKGTIKLTTYYPTDKLDLGEGFRIGRMYSPEIFYAFEIADGTSSLYAYGTKTNPNVVSMRNQLLEDPSGRLKGSFYLFLDPKFPHNDNRFVHATYVGLVTEGITDNTKKSDTPETENSGDKQAGKREPEKGSTDDSKPKGSWPWWIYVASFIVACILYKCIEAWKYGTWDSRRREDRKRKIKKRGEHPWVENFLQTLAREKEVVKTVAEEGRLKKPLIADPIVEKAIRKELRKPTGELTKADLEKVTRLELRDNKLTDVKGLENLTQLTYLDLQGNQLAESPKGLEKLTQLTELNLGRNQLTSVKGLENLTKLETLNLYKTQLMDPDVKSLMMLTKLTWLELGRNPDLTKAQIWLLKKALPKCRINSNA